MQREIAQVVLLLQRDRSDTRDGSGSSKRRNLLCHADLMDGFNYNGRVVYVYVIIRAYIHERKRVVRARIYESRA